MIWLLLELTECAAGVSEKAADDTSKIQDETQSEGQIYQDVRAVEDDPAAIPSPKQILRRGIEQRLIDLVKRAQQWKQVNDDFPWLFYLSGYQV